MQPAGIYAGLDLQSSATIWPSDRPIPWHLQVVAYRPMLTGAWTPGANVRLDPLDVEFTDRHPSSDGALQPSRPVSLFRLLSPIGLYESFSPAAG